MPLDCWQTPSYPVGFVFLWETSAYGSVPARSSRLVPEQKTQEESRFVSACNLALSSATRVADLSLTGKRRGLDTLIRWFWLHRIQRRRPQYSKCEFNFNEASTTRGNLACAVSEGSPSEKQGAE